MWNRGSIDIFLTFYEEQKFGVEEKRYLMKVFLGEPLVLLFQS